MMTRSLILALVLILGSSSAVWAQSALSSDANKAVQITEERQKNSALMRHYTWMSRTEILKDAQIKDNRLEMCNYDPFGRLQRNLMNDQSAPLPFGFLRRAVAENERQEMEQYLTGLRGMIDQYTLPSTGKILDFMMSAKPMGPDAMGLFSMTGTNVINPGDSMTLWVNAMTRHLARVQVNTTFQGNPVQLSATFNTLPSGLNYMSFAEVTVPSKQLSVQVQNFDYNKNN